MVGGQQKKGSAKFALVLLIVFFVFKVNLVYYEGNSCVRVINIHLSNTAMKKLFAHPGLAPPSVSN